MNDIYRSYVNGVLNFLIDINCKVSILLNFMVFYARLCKEYPLIWTRIADLSNAGGAKSCICSYCVMSQTVAYDLQFFGFVGCRACAIDVPGRQ